MKELNDAVERRIQSVNNEAEQQKEVILKAAGFVKRAYIEKQDCEQSDGTKGSYVVKSHETGEQLGCFTSKQSAENYLQAAHANK